VPLSGPILRRSGFGARLNPNRGLSDQRGVERGRTRKPSSAYAAYEEYIAREPGTHPDTHRAPTSPHGAHLVV